MFKSSDYEAIEFRGGLHEKIMVKPMYHILGFAGRPEIYGRKLVLDKLQEAVCKLPSVYGIVIWDVYRNRECQGKLFEWMRGEVRKKYPQLTDEENYETARKYMSPPSKIGDTYCPPHLSGGAVDLSLYDVSSGKEFEMGTPFDDCTNKAHANYYELLNELSEKDIEIRERRRLLYQAMTSVGFTSYDYEWWHFDIGNVFWSRKIGMLEVFGPLFGDKEMP